MDPEDTKSDKTDILVYHLIWYKWIYIQSRNRFTDIENKSVFFLTKGKRSGGGLN